MIGNLVVDSVNSTFVKKEVSSSQKQAVISLIHKEGKDPLFKKNYRPISLLNVDYTILTKLLSIRIKTVLNELISVDQVRFLKDRNIGEAIRMIDDIINHTSVNEIPGYMMIIDFEKAFDSVSHTFLQKVLFTFGFGPSFCRWVETIL